MQLKLSDKGWLRQHYPKAKTWQVERFLENVGKKLDHLNHPTQQQVAEARINVFNEMMGCVK